MFSDLAFRVLLYAAATEGRLITIEETARVYNVSRSHLMKVVNNLTRAGYLKAVRGRAGGVTLARPASEIRLGQVVRQTEPDFQMAECFGTESQCRIAGYCRLPKVLVEALTAFLATLDQYTLADLQLTPQVFAEVIARARPVSALGQPVS